jgi:hypothetical protein
MIPKSSFSSLFLYEKGDMIIDFSFRKGCVEKYLLFLFYYWYDVFFIGFIVAMCTYVGTMHFRLI